MESFGDWLQQLMDEKGWGVRETARHVGVSHPTISAIVTLGDLPSYETCVGIAKAFKKPLSLVLQKAGKLDHQALDEISQEIVHINERLNHRNKIDLLEYARLRLKLQEGKETDDQLRTRPPSSSSKRQ